jgi:hypothetical protein
LAGIKGAQTLALGGDQVLGWRLGAAIALHEVPELTVIGSAVTSLGGGGRGSESDDSGGSKSGSDHLQVSCPEIDSSVLHGPTIKFYQSARLAY